MSNGREGELLGGENKSFWSGTNHERLLLLSCPTSSDNGIAGGDPNRISFLSSCF